MGVARNQGRKSTYLSSFQRLRLGAAVGLDRPLRETLEWPLIVQTRSPRPLAQASSLEDLSLDIHRGASLLSKYIRMQAPSDEGQFALVRLLSCAIV